jgi:transposase
VNTKLDSEEAAGARRRRRRHSDEFKADAVAACIRPGVSIAAVALSRGLNANLLRRWVQAAELRPAPQLTQQTAPAPAPTFVPLQLPAPRPPKDIHVELRRGATTIIVTWPGDAAGEFAAWMRELVK